MKVLVCGGRDFSDWETVYTTLDNIRYSSLAEGLTVIQGGATGADKIAVDWCLSRLTPFEHYRADWKRQGKAAGPLRNQRMIDEGKPDLVVAFPGGRGTADMVARARKAGIKVMEIPASNAALTKVMP